jgi:serine O-acetyltransferase
MSKLRADIERFCALRGTQVPLSALQLSMACFNPRVLPVVLLRLAEWSDKHGLGLFAKLFAMLNVLMFGIEVSPKVEIGGGLFLPHTVGTVIGAERIGSNCTIMQGVTLGSAEPDLGFTATTRPVIGDDVLIGAGAKVIGRVIVGDHVKIGANAVVLKDVPAHSLAVGVPATVRTLGDIDG